MASFAPVQRVRPGESSSRISLYRLGEQIPEMQVRISLPFTIGQVLGRSFKVTKWRYCVPGAASECTPSVSGATPFWVLKLPPFTLDHAGSMPGAPATEFPEITPAGEIQSVPDTSIQPPAFLPAIEPPSFVTGPAVEFTQTELRPALSGFAAAPGAEALEVFLPQPLAPVAMSFEPRALSLPRLDISEDAVVQEPDLTRAPEAAASFRDVMGGAAQRPMFAACSDEWSALQAHALLQPGLELHASAQLEPAVTFTDLSAAYDTDTATIASFEVASSAAEVRKPQPARWRPTPLLAFAGPAAPAPPQALENLLPALPQPLAVAFPATQPAAPEITLTAGDPEVLEPAPPILIISPVSEAFEPSLPACAAERQVLPAFAAVQEMHAAVQLPSIGILGLAEPTIREDAGLAPVAEAVPVVAIVAPQIAGHVAAVAALRTPDFGILRESAARTQAPELAAAVSGPAPVPVEAELRSSAIFAILSLGEALRVPVLGLQQASGSSAGDFLHANPVVSTPAAAALNTQPEQIREFCNLSLLNDVQATIPGVEIPKPDLLGLDFFCERAPMAPSRGLEWRLRAIEPEPPKFNIRPVFERLEEVVAHRQANRTPGFAEIFTMPAARVRHTSKKTLYAAAKVLAASLLIGVAMWFGAGSAKIGRQMLAVNTDIFHVPGGSGTVAYSAPNGTPTEAAPAPERRAGVMDRMRQAIQHRAAVELSDSFKGMEAWGATANALPAGWSRNRDGFVKTGQLALYTPSLNFSDYRMEFLGEIENKAMSWAVRAKDKQNYYAVKFKVIEPGLRPVIAVVHYPVVGGKAGQRVETPLNVMVHNLTAYHVAVDVKGNHVSTSIDGQEVDSFSDDSIKTGGVGFFADAGESARLYWVKVTKNQDWLGRVCAYLAGGSESTITGELSLPDTLPGPNGPGWPLPAPDRVQPKDILLAANEAGEFNLMSPQRARTPRNGRTESCS